MNTKISYLYRDNSNYKKWNFVIVKGVFSEEMINRIMDSLYDGEWFVPRQVGFEEDRFYPLNEDDIPFFELYRSGFEPTVHKETVELSPEEVTRNFINAKGRWDQRLEVS